MKSFLALPPFLNNALPYSRNPVSILQCSPLKLRIKSAVFKRRLKRSGRTTPYMICGEVKEYQIRGNGNETNLQSEKPLKFLILIRVHVLCFFFKSETTPTEPCTWSSERTATAIFVPNPSISESYAIKALNAISCPSFCATAR